VIVQALTCPVFVGRAEELGALHDARRALAQSRGAVVLVGGEAGIGKSRLLAHFLAHVARDPRPRHLASAECIERAERPFGPFRELLEALGLAFPGANEPLEKGEVFARVVGLLQSAAAKRATILTIEDLQWADRSSLELLTYLAARVGGTRLLLVATYRSDEVESREPLFAAISRLSREPTVARIAVDARDAAQTRGLIERAIEGRAALSDAARDDVVKRSEGNPFFAEELLKDAFEGSVRPRDVRLPISIRATIAERLRLLELPERQVLAHASVLGFRFEPELLALMMDTDLDAVLPVLRRARDLNVLIEEGDGPAPVRFRFRHAITREVVYETMLQFDARRTHERLLQTLEALDGADRHVDALAYHAWAAHDVAKTFRYNERAGIAALSLRALPEARACFERALQAARGPEQEAQLLERLGFVLEMQGALAEAIERFEGALARYRELGDFDRAIEMVRAIATNRNNTGDFTAAAFGAAFLDEYGDRVGQVPRDTMLALLARLSTIAYDNAGAARFIARIEAPRDLLPRARQNMLIAQMDLAFFAGDVAAWRSYVARLFETATALPPFVALTALYAVAQSATMLGLGEVADRALARADRIEEAWDFGALRAHGAAVRALHAYLSGRLDAARAEIVRALAGTESAVARAALALVAPLVAVAVGEPSLVPAQMEEEFAEHRHAARIPDDTAVLAAAAAWAIERGDVAGARRDLRLAIDCLPRATALGGSALVYGATYLEPNELAPLRALISQPFDPSDVPGRAYAGLAAAILEQRFGDPAAARAKAVDAATGFRACGRPLLEAWALEIAGEPEAARALYARCGATAQARRLGAPPEASAAPSSGNVLSKREEDVARKVALGATNAQIAGDLAISIRTVEKHIASIFSKLGLRKRSQIAAAFARED